VDERCERAEGEKVKSSVLFGEFKKWCAVEGVESDDVPTQKLFGGALTVAGFDRKLSNGTWYVGLRLTDQDGTFAEGWNH
jgi:hypothetical protein